jgi:type I restriction enzyme S subunit
MSNNFCIGQLQKIIDFKNGKSIEKQNGKIPIYGGNGILVFTQNSIYENLVIIGRVGAYCGSVHIETNKCWVSDNAIAGLPKDNNDIFYIYYLLKSIGLNKQHIGSSQPLLTQGILNNISVKIFFDLLEQKKIAAVLSALDAKIEINNRINAELESLAKTIYDYWFVQFDLPNENGKPYKTSGGEMVYHPELKREIPAGWEVSPIKDLIDILNGYAFKSEDYTTNGIFVLRTKNFGQNSIVEKLGDDVFLPLSFTISHEKYLCQEYDYHLVMVGASVGNRGLIYPCHLPALRNQNMWCFRPKQLSKIGKAFTKYFLDNLIEKTQYLASGSAREFFNKSDFNSRIVFVPNLKILDLFERTIFPLMKIQANHVAQNQQLTQLRDWLLPLLMNGQITMK